MRKHGFLLLVLMLVLCTRVAARESTIGDPGLDDPFMPLLGNGGYDTLHYTIDITVDVENNNITDATTTIEAEAVHDLTAFNLDFIGYDINEITVNGEEAQFERNERELTIYPPETLAEDETFTIVVRYSGSPSDIDEEFVFGRGWQHHDGGVYVVSEPIGAQSWYPVNDHPLDKATYTIRVTVPAPYVVASNGLLQETIEDGDWITYAWESQNTIASYLVTVHIGDFVIEEEEGPNGLPIRNYYASRIADEVESEFDDQAQMIAFFNEIFGPYPFEAYGAVVVDEELGFALETQTLSTFGYAFINEVVVAHELAHQWFGNSISLSRWQEIWLNEGFATYASWLWLEERYGTDALEQSVQDVVDAFSNSSFLIGVTPPGRPEDSLFNAGVYYRGALVLHGLRIIVGDEDFFEILRTYTERYAYGNATIEGFIAIAEEISGKELSAYFDDWLYDRRMPALPER